MKKVAGIYVFSSYRMKSEHFIVDCMILLLVLCIVCTQTAPANIRSIRRHHRHEKSRQEKLNRSEVALRRLRLQGDKPAECCPSSAISVEPVIGRSATGMAVELYRGPNTTQVFHETVCKPNVVDKPCRFIEKSVRKLSRCVQQTSLVYALVRDVGTRQHFRMDYISIRTGCVCQIIPPDDDSQLAPS